MATTKPTVILDFVGFGPMSDDAGYRNRTDDMAKSGSITNANDKSFTERQVARAIIDSLTSRLYYLKIPFYLVPRLNKKESEDNNAVFNTLRANKLSRKDCIFIDVHASFSTSKARRGPMYQSNNGDSAGKTLGETIEKVFRYGVQGCKNAPNETSHSVSNKDKLLLENWAAACLFCPMNISSDKDIDLFYDIVSVTKDGASKSITSISTTQRLRDYGRFVGACITKAITELYDYEYKTMSLDNYLESTVLGNLGGIGGILANDSALSQVAGFSLNIELVDGVATGDGSSYTGTKYGEEYDMSTVSFNQLLEASYDEKKYGPSIAQIVQPLVKYTNEKAYSMESDENIDATEILKAYAKYYLESNNANVDVCSLQLISAPWLRPGFNIWLDPIFEDKIYYINGITHSGSPGGVYTSLDLAYGRRRSDFLTTGKNRKLGSIGEDDNIFTKGNYLKQAKDFGSTISTSAQFKQYRDTLKQISSSLGNGVYDAGDSPYSIMYKAENKQSTIRNPVINVVNENGQIVFTQDEWCEITGKSASEYNKLLADEKKEETSETVDNESNINDADAVKKEQAVWQSGKFVCGNPLSINKSGTTVMKLQSILNYFIKNNVISGDMLTTDGKFGVKTEDALKAYQKAKGLDVDGICGPKTVAQINTDLPNVSDRSVESEGKQIATANASGRLSGEFFDGEFTIDEIQAKLNKIYKKAPEVVTRRKNVIKKGCKALRESMDMYYTNNDWNK